MGYFLRQHAGSPSPDASLMQVPGGYFVRQQDGDLKYLVAFNSPEVRAADLVPSGATYQQCLCVCLGGLCYCCESAGPYQGCFYIHVQAALCWCMAMQECAMCLSWPDSALRHWATERGEAGQLLFRGPRCVGTEVC